LKEIVQPLIIDLDHELALLWDIDADDVKDKFVEDFYEELDKLEICSQHIGDRSDAADFSRQIVDGVVEFFVDREIIYYKDIIVG
jgi:hypothetical protein